MAVLVVVLSVAVVAGALALRGRTGTCPIVPVGQHGKIYAISSHDIGHGLSCATVRHVVRAWSRRHYPARVYGWTIAYRDDCLCRTAKRRAGARRLSFVFDST